MTQSSKSPTVVAIGTALAGGLLLSGASFAVTPLAQGYLLGAQEASTAPQAADKAQEGKCGMDKVDSDGDGKVSRAEFEAMHPGEAEKFASIDANGDGFIDQAEHEAHKSAQEGKCGEGKCGEGKCGGMA